MPNKDKNIPKRRFKEFENADAWELRKLGELGEIVTGSTPPIANEEYYSDKGIPWITPTDIETNIISDSAKKLSAEGAKIGRVVRANSILCTCIASIGKNALLTTNGSFNQQINSLTPYSDNDSYFLLTSSELWSIQMKQIASSGTMQIVNKTEFSELRTMIPSLPEQEAIGTFFSTLDCHITLHQRKLDKLKSVKQAYLSEMFPAEGERVPKRRFPGFTDDWELRKFDECFNFPVSTNSLSRALLNYDEGDIKSVHYGDILIKYPAILNIKNDKIPYITGGKLEKYKSSLLENGDLIFADAAEDETVGKAVEVNGLTEENLVAGLHTIVARPKDKKAEFFLGYYINSNTYHRQLLRLIQGSKVSSISKGNLQKTLVSFPKDFEEQQKIGAFFKKIDDTITLHQRKS